MLHDDDALVAKIASEYQSRCALALDALIAAGKDGLARARQFFDPAEGHRWDSYATWWVRQRIRLAMARSRAG
ncbi:MAG TPA: hypothetical protein DGT21_25260 [Armatimonadetes bacterium]|jgi:DNA-directed RNA polymerase sigma subunit (sigma70/sigma32)|nr:hypothetical protein [Armatimonadota bacterium]